MDAAIGLDGAAAAQSKEQRRNQEDDDGDNENATDVLVHKAPFVMKELIIDNQAGINRKGSASGL
jgi:hypothetical protein